MKAKKKRGVDAPPKVRAYINHVTSFPLEIIDVPLARFYWDYEKGDFTHWVDLMNHFDSYLEKYVKPRKDLQLEGSFLDADCVFPKESVLQILRVTQIILENCVNRYCYSSVEHLSTLLASTDADVVTASLQTLAAFAKKPVQSNRAVRWHGDPVLNARLFSLSQGWGGKEEGLGLLACAIEDGCDAEALELGSTLHFEFYSDGSVPKESEENGSGRTSGLKVIHMCVLHMRCENDLQLLKQIIDQYKVPASLRFSLLTRLRFAKAFPFLPIRRQYLCIRLLAFTILLQSNPDHEDLTAFFTNEPEFVNELVTLLQCEDAVPEDIRILAVLALAAQSQDRPRQSNVLNFISAGGHRGILPSLMQKAVVSVTGGNSSCSVSFAEALLSLVTILVSSSSGCAALREAGLIPTLLPFLKDMDPLHTHLVSSAVHILEAFMDYSNPAATLFRDLGGLDDAITRLKLEVSQVEESAEKRREESKPLDKEKVPAVQGDNQQSHSEPLIPSQQRLLLKALLRAIALGTYAPGHAARLHGSEESALPTCLCTIFRHAKEFGGGVFSLAASLMSDLIHKDPTCYSALESAGLPAAFLDAITSEVLPSSEAVSCIPHSLDALCLNNSGLQAVKDCNALSCFVKIFTSRVYLRALSNETPGALATGLDELMRHASTLRGPGVDMCIEILKAIAIIGGGLGASVAIVTEDNGSDGPVPMETDSEVEPVVHQSGEDQLKTATHQQADVIGPESVNVEVFLPECINNAVRLLETILQNADTSRVFIEKKGIEALLQLYTLPYLPVSFGGSSIAHTMSSTFRGFSPQHSGALTRAVCSALRNHLIATLEVLTNLATANFYDLESADQNKVVKSLASTECFLSLSSVLVRSTNNMMTELSNGDADILNDVGKVHRAVLWQISLFDARREIDAGSNMQVVTTQALESREGDDETGVLSLVRYVNPVSIRNGPLSHWNMESDFLPMGHAGEGLHRRTRREQGGTAEVLTQMARLGRLARHAEATQIDLEGCLNPQEGTQVQELVKRKSPDYINCEIMMRLVSAARGLYVALGKAMVVPSRRRDDAVAPSSIAKAVAAAFAKLICENLSFDGHCDASMSVKCRYLGKVVDDIIAVVFDNRRRTCNTLLVNNLYSHGALRQLFVTFEATSQLLWVMPLTSQSPLESEKSKVETEKCEDKVEKRIWCLETLQSYAKLMEHLVTPSLLLAPPSMAQLLVQQGAGGSHPVPRGAEAFVQKVQAQVLEVILPVWYHPMFPRCSPSLITSLAAIITHIYSGIGDVKGHKNAGAGSRFLGPPPDESSIAMIVEMGFSRARAEEALRRVERNSVSMAMEWLFSHPEEPQEDDELARALALSLGNSESHAEESAGKGKEVLVEEEKMKVPQVEDMLGTCMTLLQNTDAIAFPLTDLLVTICNRNKGVDRSRVVSYLIQQLKQSQIEEFDRDCSPLSIISHTLALVLSEDSMAREVAAENEVVNVALDMLSSFNPKEVSESSVVVPKWVIALLLVLDHMLQYKPKVNQDPPSSSANTINSVKGDSSSSQGDKELVIEEEKKEQYDYPFTAVLGKPTGYMTDSEQHRAMTVACNLLQSQLPATTAQAVLQLCARLTKSHAVAMQFLESRGLSAILSLPRQCLFPGFDSVAAAIIRHLLEDPQTLQQAMESEIRHMLLSTLHRHNGRVPPRMFLTAMAPVVSRDPAIFMQAATAVCQIESVGGRMNVALLKEKEKEKERDKEKDRDKEKEDGEKSKAMTAGAQVETGPSQTFATSSDGSSKAHDTSNKSLKGHHKKVPHSFLQVIDQLLEVVLHFPPPFKDVNDIEFGSGTAMEVEEHASKEKGKTKVEEQIPSNSNLSESSAGLAKVAFILKLLMEILLMYSCAVGVVLRRDLESSLGRSPSLVGGGMIGHGGLLYHILHRLLAYPADEVTEKLNEDEWREKLSDKAAYFLMTVCVRSGEGRRRVVSEISRALSLMASISDKAAERCLQPPSRKVRAFIDLINLILSAHSTSSNAQVPGYSTDMAKTMIDIGLVQSLTSILQVIDLDHPEAPKLVNAILKALEALTRAASSGDQVYGVGGITRKRTAHVLDGRYVDPRVPFANGQPLDAPQQSLALSDQAGDQNISDPMLGQVQISEGTMLGAAGNNDGRDNRVEHDLQLGSEGVEAEAEEFMDGTSQDPSRLGDGATGVNFRVERRIENRQDEDDEEMDVDDGEDDGEEEEEEEDDEEEDEMEGAEGVPHFSPPDTDAEDQEVINNFAEEFGADVVGDEDEEEDWQENQVIEVRWRNGFTGLNHVQVLGHPGTAGLVDFPGDPFQGVNMDGIFSSFRRPAVVDRRRPGGYRPFPERPGGDRGGPFHHPLLRRPSSSSGGASSASISNSALWSAAGNITRDTEALLGGGLDVTHVYINDGPIFGGHLSDGFFGERGVGGPPPLLDFSMDPVYLMGRRGVRGDGRLSSWTDDGQPQAGAHAAAIAQAIEEQFIAHLRSLLPEERLPADQVRDRPMNTEQVEQPHVTMNAAADEREAAIRITESEQDMETNRSQENHEQSEISTDLTRSLSVASAGEGPNGGADVQMEDENNAQVSRHTEAVSQDNGEREANIGESMRSLEVEIGSADGRDDILAEVGLERLAPDEIPPSTGLEVSHRPIETDSRVEHNDAAEEMVSQSARQVLSVIATDVTRSETSLPEAQEGDGNARSEEAANRNESESGVNTIDPTFLEALPEDLRAEVLASQQNQTVRAANVPPPPTEDIDPEFLAALPPDIQAEVLAQQRAQRLIQAQQVEGQPVDMDSASIIATFPAELREEVLLTSSEQVLAALPPSLLAEAQLLRERAMNQYQARGIFGGPRRLVSRRTNMGVATGGPSAIDRGVGNSAGLSIGRRLGVPVNTAVRMREVEGKTLVDTAALKAMLQLLRLAQPLGKGILHRLLLNLCAHSITRATLIKLLLDMLRPEAEGSLTNSPFGDLMSSQRLYGCQWNIVYARSQLSDGVPPLVSRRVLEILTYLSQNHPLVAGLLLYLEPGGTSFEVSQSLMEAKNEKGKAKVVDNVGLTGVLNEEQKGEVPLILLLKLLNQPLYSRSSGHLEQVMGLLEVVTSNVGAKLSLRYKSEAAENLTVSDDTLGGEGVHSSRGHSGASSQDGSGQNQTSVEAVVDTEDPHPCVAPARNNDNESSEPSTSGTGGKMDTLAILLSLPELELRKLCRLLARDGLSDVAYTRVAEVLKKLAHVAPSHRGLFISELADATQSLSSPAIRELNSLGDTESIGLSTGSMAGGAFLRVLQCLSILTSGGSSVEKDQDSPSEREQEEGLVVVRELNVALEPLWQELSVCIGKIENKLGNYPTSSTTTATVAAGPGGVSPPLPPGTQRVLPFVEAFFVLCEKLRFGATQSAHPEPCSATAREIKEAACSSTSAAVSLVKPIVNQKRFEGDMTFIRFADRHRRMLNAFVRQNSALLEKSLSLLLKTPRLIDFDNKRAYFRSRIRQQHEQHHYGPLRICVRRAYVLEDSYNQLRMRTPDELKGRLTVQFQGEEGIDAGGLTREWYQLLSRVIFDKGALLFTTVGNESTFQPNPNSVYQTEHLSYFKFVGRVVAKALFDGQLLDVYFTRSFYKHILGVKVTYHDIEAVDPDYYKNLKWMLENDISDIVGLFFSVDADEEKHILYEKTEVTDIELIPGGRNIRVTEENKHDYVDLNAEHKLTTAIRPQINAFLEGFNELTSRDLISIFNDKELELLISGLPEIDLEDLKANTEYTGYTAASPVVRWFWDVVRAFNKEDMARLLQFITGTSKVPLEGFRALQGISGPQRFQIHKAYGAPERLPSAHTCFNQLDLPEYSSEEQLQERLLLAIHEGSEGFGFG